jgi:hypothetical protein
MLLTIPYSSTGCNCAPIQQSWCHERERSGHRYYTRLINATPLRLTYSADERTLSPRWLGWDGPSVVLDMTSLSAHRQGSPHSVSQQAHLQRREEELPVD